MLKKLFLFALISINLYSQTNSTNKVLIPFREKNLWGLSDTLGTIKVKPVYNQINDFIIDYRKDFSSKYVVKSNKTYFVIDQNSNILLPKSNTYDSIKLNKYCPDYFWVYKNGKVGLFHSNKEFIPCLYDDIYNVYNESFLVIKEEKNGLINSSGKFFIPIDNHKIFASWDPNDENNPEFVWVAESNSYEKKYYDIKIPTTPDDPSPFDAAKEIIAEEVNNSKKTETNFEAKKKTLTEKYDYFQMYKNRDLAFVTLNNKKGVVTLSSMTEAVSPLYDDLNAFGWDGNDRVYLVKLDEKYGLVKPVNKIILNCEFDEIKPNHVLVKDNKKGIIVFNTAYPYIKPKYDDIIECDAIRINDNWQFGLFEVTTKNGKGYVGENGVEFFKD